MIGEIIGNYRVIRQIGAGGMGVVYLAQHTAIGRKAAIKLLLPELSANADMVSRIFNEARSTALIDHPGMVAIYDFGQHSSGSAYLVMEYLDGESLASMLRRGPLPVDMLVALGRQIAGAVGAAHQKSVVHRDLKPDNVFLVRDDEVTCGMRARVLDFGIAKLAAEDSPGSLRTRTGTIMGTPVYMSPEQCRGAGAVDHRADIYSLGCILFEMACGRPPFVHEGMGEVIAAQLYAQPTRPSALEPSVPMWLEAIILRALAKRPDDRQQTMEQLAGELGGTSSARMLGVGNSTTVYATPPPSITTLSRSAAQVMSEPPRPRPRRRFATIAAILAAAIAVAATAWLLDNEKQPASASATATATAPVPRSVPAPVPVSVPVPEPEPEPVPARAPAPEVHLSITSDPTGADIYIASTGVLLGQTPFVHRLPVTAGRAIYLLKHPGYQDRRIELPADHDGAVTARLSKKKRPRPAELHPDSLDPFGGS